MRCGNKVPCVITSRNVNRLAPICRNPYARPVESRTSVSPKDPSQTEGDILGFFSCDLIAQYSCLPQRPESREQKKPQISATSACSLKRPSPKETICPSSPPSRECSQGRAWSPHSEKRLLPLPDATTHAQVQEGYSLPIGL